MSDKKPTNQGVSAKEGLQKLVSSSSNPKDVAERFSQMSVDIQQTQNVQDVVGEAKDKFGEKSWESAISGREEGGKNKGPSR